MRNSVFCSACLLSLGLAGETMAQPVATDFRNPVLPVDQSGKNPDGYYDASPFLAPYKDKRHLGEDWNGNGKGSTDYGDPVYPIAVGQVVGIYDPTPGKPHPWGKTIVTKYRLPDGRTVYTIDAHLSAFLTSMNKIVSPNKPIGKIGDADGYYKGAAHDHHAIYLGSDWTPKSPGYLKNVLIPVVKKYLDPSLFIDDRADHVWVSMAAGTLTASSLDIQMPNYAPASLAYATHGGKTLSLPLAIEAGWFDPTAYTSPYNAYQWEAKPLDSLVFSPNEDFQIKFLQTCALTIVVPGHNFQAARARRDMIQAADRAGFTRVKLETLTELGDDGTATFDLRSLCFDNGVNTGVGCLVQATNHNNPLIRYVIWYDPSTNTEIGDWIKLDPNDID